jgi:hypothetical protein
VKAGNDRTEILGLEPEVTGVTVRLVDAGTRIELDAGTHRVVVLGYDGEPYLRVDRAGVFENVRSPATYLNRSLTGDAPPASADPQAPPSWRRTGGGSVVRWHDPALHVPPGMKVGGRTSSAWERSLLDDDRPVTIEGRIVRLPARSRLPWLLVAGGLAVAVVALSTRAWRLVTVVALGAVVVADTARVVGLVAHAPTWLVSRTRVVGDTATLSVVGSGMAICALVLLAKRRRIEAATAAAASAAVLVLTGGVLEVRDLSAAVLGTSLPDAAARAAVAVVLGGGVGVGAAAVLELRRALSTPARRAPRSGSGPTPGDGTRRASPSAPASG